MSGPPPIPGNRPNGYDFPPQTQQQGYVQSAYSQQNIQQQYYGALPSNAQQSYYSPHLLSAQQPQQHQQQRQQHQQQYYQPAPQAAAAQPTQQLTGWSMLFYQDGTPAPLFETLMANFFAKLDPQGAGKIAPETLSAFLDVLGFLIEDNVWKANYKSAGPMYQPSDLADFELKAACEAWGFEHVVVVRNPGHPQLPYGGTPLLTLRGFTDMIAVEHAADPDRAWRGLNAALVRFGVWPELGPLPRQALLPSMPPQVQQRINQASVRGRQAAQQKLNANAAKNALMLQGQQNALDLIGDTRYVYY